MARKIVWKDLAVLTRFKNQITVLDNSFQYVYNPGLFSSSLLSLLSPASGFFTVLELPDSKTAPFVVGQISSVFPNLLMWKLTAILGRLSG